MPGTPRRGSHCSMRVLPSALHPGPRLWAIRVTPWAEASHVRCPSLPFSLRSVAEQTEIGWSDRPGSWLVFKAAAWGEDTAMVRSLFFLLAKQILRVRVASGGPSGRSPLSPALTVSSVREPQVCERPQWWVRAASPCLLAGSPVPPG